MLYQLVISIVVGVVLLKIRELLKKVIKRISDKYEYPSDRAFLIKKLATVVLAVFYFLLLILIWGISIQGIAVYLASFFAVAGIGLFASWSILSNMTAAVILFFEYPIKAGNKIKIQDGDNTVEGVIKNLSLFNIEIKTAQGVIYYPNNLALQKAIVKMK